MTDSELVRIHVRKGGHVQGYLTPRGTINRLKVHAVQLPQWRAAEEVGELARDNPDYSFTIQEDRR